VGSSRDPAGQNRSGTSRSWKRATSVRPSEVVDASERLAGALSSVSGRRYGPHQRTRVGQIRPLRGSVSRAHFPALRAAERRACLSLSIGRIRGLSGGGTGIWPDPSCRGWMNFELAAGVEAWRGFPSNFSNFSCDSERSRRPPPQGGHGLPQRRAQACGRRPDRLRSAKSRSSPAGLGELAPGPLARPRKQGRDCAARLGQGGVEGTCCYGTTDRASHAAARAARIRSRRSASRSIQARSNQRSTTGQTHSASRGPCGRFQQIGSKATGSKSRSSAAVSVSFSPRKHPTKALKAGPSAGRVAKI